MKAILTEQATTFGVGLFGTGGVRVRVPRVANLEVLGSWHYNPRYGWTREGICEIDDASAEMYNRRFDWKKPKPNVRAGVAHVIVGTFAIFFGEAMTDTSVLDDYHTRLLHVENLPL